MSASTVFPVVSLTEDKNFKREEGRGPHWDYFLRHITGGKAK